MYFVTEDYFQLYGGHFKGANGRFKWKKQLLTLAALHHTVRGIYTEHFRWR